MKEQLISLETAKLAKEKGFNLNSPAFYGCDNPSSGKESNQLILREWENWVNFGNEDSPQEGTAIYSASTQSLLQKWLREVYKIHITITSQSQESWQWHIQFPHDSLNKLWEDGLKRIFNRKPV